MILDGFYRVGSDKGGCACLAQLPGRGETEQERPRRIADRHIQIVTSKMSYAQMKERVV